MDRRAPSPLILSALLLGLAACSGPEADAAPVATGGAVPAEWIPGPWADPPGTYLVWVARTADCFSCQDLDYEFRRVQAAYGGEVPLLVLHVGRERNTGIPRSYLEDRRVTASYHTITARHFERRYPSVAVPGLYLVHEGRIVWSAADVKGAAGGRVRLDTLVDRFHRPLDGTVPMGADSGTSHVMEETP